MASAQISETTRPAYVWNGTEWVPIGDGGGGGGGEIYYQSASPSNPAAGTLWVDEDGTVEDDIEGITHNHDSQYLSLSSASNTYLTINDASSTYATIIDLNNIDLTSTINTASAAAYNEAVSYTNSASVSLSSYVDTQVINLINSAPGALDTLNELSAALNNDPNFYSTVQAVYLSQSSASTTYVAQTDTQLVKYGSSEPSSPATGTLWIDTTDPLSPVTKVYNGSTWIEVGGGGSEIRSGRLLLMGA